MDKSTRKVLKEIVYSGRLQKSSPEVSVTYLLNRLGISRSELFRNLQYLEDAGYTKTTIKGRITLVRATEKGTHEIFPKRGVGYWVTVLGIPVALITIINFIPTLLKLPTKLSQVIYPSSNTVIIQSSSLSPSLAQDRLGITQKYPFKIPNSDTSDLLSFCEPFSEDCNVVLDVKSLEVPETFELRVSSATEDAPILIDGIIIELTNYQPITSDFLDVVSIIPQAGGTGPISIYSLEEPFFPLPPQNSYLAPSLSDPLKIIGKKVLATLNCESEPCEKFRYLQNQESESLILDLSFTRNIAPGWYEFEVSVKFSYQGKNLISETKPRFSIVKPEIIHPRLGYDLYETIPSFVDLNTTTRQVVSNLPLSNSNLSGYLLFNSQAGLDNGHYLWNLSAGEVNHFGDLGILPIERTMNYYTNPQQYNANGWEKVDAFMFQGYNIPSDIGVINYAKSTFRRITSTPSLSEIYPSYSPSGDRIIYVSYAMTDTDILKRGEADIFVFDLVSQKTNRLTYTPSIIEATPTWISDNTVAYIMPQINEFADTPINGQVGIGLINLESLENQILSTESLGEFSYLQYLPKSQKLVAADGETFMFYTASGKLIDNITVPSNFYGCNILDTYPYKVLCHDDTSIKLYIPSNNQLQKLIDVRRDRFFNLTALIGWVEPEGFIIVEPEINTIHQYLEDGSFLSDWVVPNLQTVFSWWTNDIRLIPSIKP